MTTRKNQHPNILRRVTGALERFKVRGRRWDATPKRHAESFEEYRAYVDRKTAEKAALERRIRRLSYVPDRMVGHS